MGTAWRSHEAGATLRDQLKYGGYYEYEACTALKEVLNVDAHKSLEEAIKEGWEEHWKGNSAAPSSSDPSCSARKRSSVR